MSVLQQIHFLRPLWLLAVVPLIIIVWLLLRRKLFSRSWQSVCDKNLLPYILIGMKGNAPKWPVYILAVVGLLIITAMAGPVWEKLPQPVYRTQSGLVIVLDMSQSMDATDIKPSRVARAKHKILDILGKRTEGQTALVVYASEAFVVSPLSDDVKTIESLVTSLSTDIMPNQGSRPALAIDKAAELLRQGGMRSGHILLITDGLGNSAPGEIANALQGQDYRLSILAIGTAGGAPIELSDGSLLKDKNGDIVLPKLDEAPLRNLASLAHGRYIAFTTNDVDIDYLIRGFAYNPIQETQDAQLKKMQLDADTWREEGPWLLLAVLPFVALAFRRGWLSVVLLCVFMPMPQVSHALSWDDLFKNKDQQAEEAFQKGDHRQAAKLFQDPQWQAAANYKAGNYEDSLKQLESESAPASIYNKGNALTRLGRLEEAINAYKEVMQSAIDHDSELYKDARYNKELLEKYMQQQQSQQGDKSDNKDKQSGQEQKDKQEQAQSGEGEEQDNQSASQNQQQQGSPQDSAQNSSQENQQAAQNQQQADQKQNSTREEEEQMRASDDNNPDENKKQQDSKNIATQDQQNKSDEQNDSQDKSQQDARRQEFSEANQAYEQWLRRIPDDPGGLLRRKFRYQSQVNPQKNRREDKPW